MLRKQKVYRGWPSVLSIVLVVILTLVMGGCSNRQHDESKLVALNNTAQTTSTGNEIHFDLNNKTKASEWYNCLDSLNPGISPLLYDWLLVANLGPDSEKGLYMLFRKEKSYDLYRLEAEFDMERNAGKDIKDPKVFKQHPVSPDQLHNSKFTIFQNNKQLFFLGRENHKPEQEFPNNFQDSDEFESFSTRVWINGIAKFVKLVLVEDRSIMTLLVEDYRARLSNIDKARNKRLWEKLKKVCPWTPGR